MSGTYLISELCHEANLVVQSLTRGSRADPGGDVRLDERDVPSSSVDYS